MWLKEELDSHSQDIIVVCTHVPIIEPFTSPNHKMVNEYEVRKLLKSHKNPVVVLQGHYHATKIKQDGNLLVVTRSKLRLMGTEKLYGEEGDRNASFELGRKE